MSVISFTGRTAGLMAHISYSVIQLHEDIFTYLHYLMVHINFHLLTLLNETLAGA